MEHLLSALEQGIAQLIAPLEWVMLLLIIGGGLYLVVQSKAQPLGKLKSAFLLLLSKEKAQP